VIRSESTEYVVFDADSGEKLTVIDHLEINGHPSYSGDGRLLTDTNPDSDGKRNLSLVDDEKIVPIGTIYSPWMGGDRCDLHPRWNNSGTKVCIDSDHTGTRAMYVFDISARTDENGFES
jgi:Tol biopolymer transport system component